MVNKALPKQSDDRTGTVVSGSLGSGHGDITEDWWSDSWEDDHRTGDEEAVELSSSSGTETQPSESESEVSKDSASEKESRVEKEKMSRRQQTAASIIAEAPKLSVTLLGFLAERGPVSVTQLLEYGPSDKMFDVILGFYDVGLVVRDGARVSASPAGVDFLDKLE